MELPIQFLQEDWHYIFSIISIDMMITSLQRYRECALLIQHLSLKLTQSQTRMAFQPE